MRHLLCPLFWFLAACAPHTKTVSVDPAFGPAYDQFLKDGAAVGSPQNIDDLIIKFDNPVSYGCSAPIQYSSLEGCCHKEDGESPVIVIDKGTWDKMDKEDVRIGIPEGTSKTVLIFHELGHCVLGRNHDNATHSGGGLGGKIPASIMESTMSGYMPSLFSSFHEDYAKELFKKGEGPVPFGN